MIAVALVWFTQISVNGSFVSDVLGPSLLAGFGLGLAFVPVTIAAVTGVTPDEAGLASGLINTSQQVGGALGLAILVSIANSTTVDQLKTGVKPAAALTAGFGRIPGRHRLRRHRRDPGRHPDQLRDSREHSKNGSARRGATDRGVTGEVSGAKIRVRRVAPRSG